MALLTLAALYPVSVSTSWLFGEALKPWLGHYPMPVRALPQMVVVVLSMTYLVMPAVTRWATPGCAADGLAPPLTGTRIPGRKGAIRACAQVAPSSCNSGLQFSWAPCQPCTAAASLAAASSVTSCPSR
ncbi:hypothetical protein ACFQDE_06910 [Deinococcus caeni]|uniref:hypothetical protein n=1 Tax=Deinococcus caeni TaxID=569127 RepID=UPI003623340E